MFVGPRLAADEKRPGMAVNACCPGYVDTDMTDGRGIKTLKDGVCLRS